MNRLAFVSILGLLGFTLTSLPGGAENFPAPDPLLSGLEAVLLELEHPSVASLWGGASGAAKGRQALGAITAEQTAFIEALRAAKRFSGVEVIFQLQRSMNAVAVLAPKELVAMLRTLDGVVASYSIPWATPNNADAAPYLGVQAVWAALGAQLHGEGIRVGIIDTGIDYLHTDFGGSASVASYQANDPSVIGDVAGFPGEKVVGGYDLAGAEYGAAHYVPAPDPDPFDYQLHGTHVAGTVAGYGVDTDGSTWRGAYDASVDTRAMRVGPGMAPQASLYAIKVFGDYAGGTLLTDAGIEWALDPNQDGDLSDHLDLVNISIGSPYGMGEGSTSTFEVLRRATEVGLLAVMSAGNSGDYYFIHGNMSSAPHAMAVAAAWHDGVKYQQMTLTEPLSIAGGIEGIWSNFSAPITTAISAPVFVLGGTDPVEDPAALPAEVAGSIVLTLRKNGQYAGPFAKVAEAAGALAVVFYQSNSSVPYTLYDFTNEPPTIPVLMIGNGEAAEIVEAAAATTVRLRLEAEEVAHPELAETIASFTSRGPSWSNGRAYLKPDIAAPGVETKSAGALTGNQMIVMKGTSMASPTAAGVMALLRQAHPDWTPMELKALAMNTAARDLFAGADNSGGQVAPSRCGAGMIDAAAAISNAGVIAYGKEAPERVSLSFAMAEIARRSHEDMYLRVENKGASAQRFRISVEPVLDMPGVEVSLPRTTAVSVPSGQCVDVLVRLTADPDQMIPLPDSTMAEVNAYDMPRHWISEEQGYLVLTADGGTENTLRAPYYAAPRRATQTQAEQADLDFDAGDTGVIRLEGQRYAYGGDEAQTPVTAAFELHERIPLDNTAAPENAWGYIEYVGVTTDYGVEGLEGSLYFAVSLHGDLPTPNIAEHYGLEIALSVNGDDYAEYALASYGSNQDAPLVVLWDKISGQGALVGVLNCWAASERNTALLRNNCYVFPVPLAALGLDEGVDTIGYKISFVDNSSAWHGFNFKRPALDFCEGKAGLPWRVDEAGSTFEVRRDWPMLATGDAIGVLLTHFRGLSGARTEMIRLPEYTPGLSASPTTLAVDDAGGTVEVAITLSGKAAFDAIQVETAGNFIQAALQEDGAKGAGALVISYEKNPTDEARSALIGLSLPSVDPVYIGLQQAACAAPESPSPINASQGSSAEYVRVQWNSVPGATEYRVYRGESAAFSEAAPLSAWIKAFTFLDTTAEAAGQGVGCRQDEVQEHRYYYWVVARGACGESGPGVSAQGWRGAGVDAKFAAPAGLLAVFLLLGRRRRGRRE